MKIHQSRSKFLLFSGTEDVDSTEVKSHPGERKDGGKEGKREGERELDDSTTKPISISKITMTFILSLISSVSKHSDMSSNVPCP